MVIIDLYMFTDPRVTLRVHVYVHTGFGTTERLPSRHVLREYRRKHYDYLDELVETKLSCESLTLKGNTTTKGNLVNLENYLETYVENFVQGRITTSLSCLTNIIATPAHGCVVCQQEQQGR